MPSIWVGRHEHQGGKVTLAAAGYLYEPQGSWQGVVRLHS
jgi:hypothetical protein